MLKTSYITMEDPNETYKNCDSWCSSGEELTSNNTSISSQTQTQPSAKRLSQGRASTRQVNEQNIRTAVFKRRPDRCKQSTAALENSSCSATENNSFTDCGAAGEVTNGGVQSGKNHVDPAGEAPACYSLASLKPNEAAYAELFGGKVGHSVHERVMSYGSVLSFSDVAGFQPSKIDDGTRSPIVRTSSLPFFRSILDKWKNTYNEDSNAYSEKGYFATTPGKMLNSRYVLIKKLGWGAFSTVWLAYDSKFKSGEENSSHPFLAVKIAKCDPSLEKGILYEIRLLKYVNERLGATTNQTTKLVDEFDIKGDFGKHKCVVMGLSGSNLLSIIDHVRASKGHRTAEEITLIKEVLQSTLSALSQLADINVLHTDIKPENVLSTNLDARIVSLMKKFVSCNSGKCDISEEDVVPYVQHPCSKTHLVALADFGLSAILEPEAEDVQDELIGRKEFPVDQRGVVSNWKTGSLIQTREYRSPEVLLGLNFNCQTDVWSVGCMAYELLTGDFLMDPKHYTQTEGKMNVVHLAMMMQLLGPVPNDITVLRIHYDTYYRDKARTPPTVLADGVPPPPAYLHKYFNSKGAFAYPSLSEKFPKRDLQKELCNVLEEKEATLAADFIMSCLHSYDPSLRPTAAELLGHKWLSGTA
ncbi:serine/threonine-protein kinase SRPK3 [Angomonas deanei]|uniref:non-specific serine/threonine protein kinase n=1 Tax=Angomonas deanei TaxID=59799 RepID=A0A7G2CAC8_9TRYP|nr:serine/threonine-protein kinase SRPK3 [Angomonas deanei]CAD2215827.1 Protein kinase domain containing protein, putative [Angomonas deanei]|eukprot:EPY19931.1 serine/threonine-protein kinase SRPK3 [Angomonas deanei]